MELDYVKNLNVQEIFKSPRMFGPLVDLHIDTMVIIEIHVYNILLIREKDAYI
jgi:hypothetical protein